MSGTNLNNSGEPLVSWLAAVKEEVAGLRFGTVQVVVHEGEVVQIERLSKRRIGPNQSPVRHLPPRSANPPTTGS